MSEKFVLGLLNQGSWALHFVVFSFWCLQGWEKIVTLKCLNLISPPAMTRLVSKRELEQESATMLIFPERSFWPGKRSKPPASCGLSNCKKFTLQYTSLRDAIPQKISSLKEEKNHIIIFFVPYHRGVAQREKKKTRRRKKWSGWLIKNYKLGICTSWLNFWTNFFCGKGWLGKRILSLSRTPLFQGISLCLIQRQGVKGRSISERYSFRYWQGNGKFTNRVCDQGGCPQMLPV